MNLLGRGPVSQDVKRRVYHREPGFIESMEMPTVCHFCGEVFDAEGHAPNMTHVNVLKPAVVKRGVLACDDCKHKTLCWGMKHHGEIETYADWDVYDRSIVEWRELAPMLQLALTEYGLDQLARCVDCEHLFYWDVGEQTWTEYVGIVSAT